MSLHSKNFVMFSTFCYRSQRSPPTFSLLFKGETFLGAIFWTFGLVTRPHHPPHGVDPLNPLHDGPGRGFVTPTLDPFTNLLHDDPRKGLEANITHLWR